MALPLGWSWKGGKGGGARGRERNRGSLVSSFLYKDASPIGLESHPYDLI